MRNVTAERPRTRNPRGEGDRLRIELLDAATDLMAEHGDIAKVSLRAIAARAGVSPTAVYRHFDDHESLLRAAVDDCWEQFETVLAEAALSSDDPFESFRRSGDAYVRFATERPGQYYVLFSNRIDLAYEGRNVGDSAFDHLVALVGAMLEANGDRRDPRFVAVQVHTWIHGIVDLTCRHDEFDWPSTDELLDELVVRLSLAPTASGAG